MEHNAVTADFFAYGSLMFADIMFGVTGSRYQSESALLRHYRRFAVRDELYPGILPKKGDIVTGVVYFDLTEAAWRRLDMFEGDMYRRKTVEVEFIGDRVASAQTFVVRPEFEFRLSRSEWSAKAFQHTGKKQFQEQYFGFKALKPPKS